MGVAPPDPTWVLRRGEWWKRREEEEEEKSLSWADEVGGQGKDMNFDQGGYGQGTTTRWGLIAGCIRLCQPLELWLLRAELVMICKAIRVSVQLGDGDTMQAYRSQRWVPGFDLHLPGAASVVAGNSPIPIEAVRNGARSTMPDRCTLRLHFEVPPCLLVGSEIDSYRGGFGLISGP
ncbi:hypothetical protein TgHK011_006016 [Trichoderma gracile]|nr:hypothetical protein TgHK011_006016 [Trichoderma gracile]